MSKMLRKHWIVVLMGAILVFALAAFFNIASEIGRPFGGFYANRSHSRNLWLVDAPTPPWWPALGENGLRYDDVLFKIEGYPYGSDAYQLYAKAQKEGRSSIELTILRGADYSAMS
jgi:hypothetical protein